MVVILMVVIIMMMAIVKVGSDGGNTGSLCVNVRVSLGVRGASG